MATFPSITRPKTAKESICRPQDKSDMTDGTVISRPKFTRSKKKWTLKWELLSDAEWWTLSQFFDQNQGSTFFWVEWRSGIQYEVRFSDDQIDSDYGIKGHRSVSLNIEEA